MPSLGPALAPGVCQDQEQSQGRWHGAKGTPRLATAGDLDAACLARTWRDQTRAVLCGGDCVTSLSWDRAVTQAPQLLSRVSHPGTMRRIQKSHWKALWVSATLGHGVLHGREPGAAITLTLLELEGHSLAPLPPATPVPPSPLSRAACVGPGTTPSSLKMLSIINFN